MPAKPKPSSRKAPSADALRRRKRAAAPRAKKTELVAEPSEKCIQWKDGTYVRRLSLYLPPELALLFKAKCARTDQKVSRAIIPLICDWLGEDPRDHGH